MFLVWANAGGARAALQGAAHLPVFGMVTMKTWSELILPFTVGAAVGFGLSFLLLASRIRFYRKFIEHRLAAINHFRGPVEKSQKFPDSL